jgi:two-component system response regulator
MSNGPILLVEDNPDDVLFTLRAFTKNHIQNEIVVATDGEEALQKLFPAEGPPLRPALILLDIKLPKVDGLEVLKRIREDPRTRTQAVVLLTSSAERRDITTAYRYHANSYIVKPVDFDQFANAVREIGMYWMVLNRPPPAVDAGTDDDG